MLQRELDEIWRHGRRESGRRGAPEIDKQHCKNNRGSKRKKGGDGVHRPPFTTTGKAVSDERHENGKKRIPCCVLKPARSSLTSREQHR